MDEFDPNSIPSFEMPRSLLDKIYDFSGAGEEGKSFMLFFVDQQGMPQVITQCSSGIVEMGIRKAAESYLLECEESSRPNINPGELD